MSQVVSSCMRFVVVGVLTCASIFSFCQAYAYQCPYQNSSCQYFNDGCRSEYYFGECFTCPGPPCEPDSECPSTLYESFKIFKTIYYTCASGYSGSTCGNNQSVECAQIWVWLQLSCDGIGGCTEHCTKHLHTGGCTGDCP